MKEQTHFRQGDIIVEEIGALPAGVVRVDRLKGQPIVLALGEVTGHHHAIHEDADSADWWKDDKGNQFVTTTEAPVEITHQEHGPIPLLPKKVYRVRRQVEYTPEAIKNVQD